MCSLCTRSCRFITGAVFVSDIFFFKLSSIIKKLGEFKNTGI